MLGPRLSNMQQGNNLTARLNILTMFVTLLSNAGSRVLQKGTAEGVIHMKISYTYSF